MKILIVMIGVAVVVVFTSWRQSRTFDRRERLSEYGFFQGQLAALQPSPGVIPYTLNTPLFSNYAEKLRFVKLPGNTWVRYNDSAVFDFPEGTVLIKNFYYPADFRKPNVNKKLLETRLLVHEHDGWQAYPYIWNEAQSDAFYDPAGEIKTISYINLKGKKIEAPYVVPNKNQCKGCHSSNNKMMPIGLLARQLNRDYAYADKTVNQLVYWEAIGMLKDVPSSTTRPRLAVWDDPKTGTLNDRARAYLEVNCAHCHSRSGPASTSGLFLDIYENDAAHLGVQKAPVAAGRGAGNLRFDIAPGDPARSIMIFRMKTTDPAIAMPEIGREQIHSEGVTLIEEWIRKNAFSMQ